MVDGRFTARHRAAARSERLAAGSSVGVTGQAEALDGRRRLLAAELTLAAIAAGDYAIEVTQGEAARVTAFRIVP
jgi:hypothetical protein